ncbi:MAG: isoprenylcysteine carboxylmethyltransferase family protein [Anaerolineae bacterium]|nr:isoprenylcysteine carboxylmethyltransferase family protein [Anaerolineae bacterium]
MEENIWSHFGNWWAVALWIVFFAIFLAFIPFYQKSQRKPASVYLAFIIALALEMFGVPLTMYVLTAVLGRQLPEGILWGHTLSSFIGDGGMIGAYICYLLGAILVIWGWRDIYKYYWSKDRTEARMVTQGIYRFIRHPQYTGFLLLTLGMLFEWATLPLLIMWPVLVWLYVRLARREEADMVAQFGSEYVEYRARTGMFLPKPWGKRPPQVKAEPKAALR